MSLLTLFTNSVMKELRNILSGIIKSDNVNAEWETRKDALLLRLQ